MREKELLLREVADIQGGENRRILLDLKSVLEEVQVEVKREEEKRSDLQLQYTKDRCAWELEKAELKCRIAQLEAREGAGLVSGGVQSGAGPGSVASQGAAERHGETSTFRREREEQRRLLADTRSAAMDLRCRLEHNERDWSREKAEMLERFDTERREWESQLRDMQRKIEELYCEVRAKREGTGLETGVDSGTQDDDDIAHRLSIHSTSTGSSLLSDQSRSEPLSSSSQSEPPKHLPFPGFYCHSNISDGGCGGRDNHHSPCFQGNSLCELNVGGPFAQNDQAQPDLEDELRPRDPRQRDSVTDSKEAVDTAELEAIFQGAPGCGVPHRNTNTSKGNVKYVHVGPLESPIRTELSYGSDKKKNTTALNAALKEIARVSEELCSYQDEIRKKTGDKRNRSESLYLPEEREMLLGHVNTGLELDEAPCDLNQIYDDLRALEKENWINLTPDNTWRANSVLAESWRTNSTGPDSHGDNQTNPTIPPEMDTEAPPVPPRTSSWSLSSPTPPEPELHIPESSIITGRRCHSPCVLVDRKCSSPSIVRKFEAMLQENEGKVLADGVVASCSVPTNSNCNAGCCHNRWSCDASKFSNSKLSTYMPVQKSFSEINILTAGKDLRPNYRPAVGNLKSPEGHQMPPVVKELPVDLLLPSLEIPPACPNLQGSRRNIMLEQKTAEFNRTLFQAEMGRGVEDSFIPTYASSSSSDEVPTPKETNFDLRPQCAEVTSGIINVHPQITLSPSTSDPTIQNPEVQLRGTGCDPQGQGVRLKQEVPPDLSPQQSEVRLREATTVTSLTATHHSEVKHKAQTPNSPCRKTQHRAATETLFSEPALPANIQPAQNVAESITKKENPHGVRPHPAKVCASTQQPSPEARPRQTAQPRHTSVTSSQSDTPRPGPRVMTDHPWKPLTLAAYPRPEGSRSNYGAVERILKSYESAAQQNQSQQHQMASSPNLSTRQEENVIELLGMLDMDPLPLPPVPRHTHFSHTTHTHTAHAQLSSHSAMGVKELRLTVQENRESSLPSCSIQKNFSRPARPANRRLPARWASRSPSSSSSSSSSPSTTPVVPPSVPLQKHTSSFAYSHAFHMETVII
ncbi:protein SOGA3a isoform X1 [Centroberyx affinis]|uniref:protein SOGA3a isoform X1 n=1 Tax=Centroberyx affinis TaxID=166261 RepID=UPI003A5BFA8A